MTTNNKYKMSFEYNKTNGKGDLVLHDYDEIIGVWQAMTGVVKDGKLKYNINPHTWYMIDKPQRPVESEYHRMYIKDKPGFGWKQRLWPIPVPRSHDPISHYLIHPDGNVPGTLGCLGLQGTNAPELYYFFKWIFTKEPSTIIQIKISQFKIKNH